MINDSLGHAAGDHILIQAATRFASIFPERELMRRMASDEFVALGDRSASESDASALAHRIIKLMSEPFVLPEATVHIGASVGLAIHPKHGSTGPELLVCADRALYAVKRSGKTAFATFDPDTHTFDEDLSLLRSELEGTLQTLSGLRVEYQPVVVVQDGSVAGREDLVRWRHPIHRELSPAALIPIAERTALITALGECVLRQSFADATTWLDAATLSVNVSPAQLREDSAHA